MNFRNRSHIISQTGGWQARSRGNNVGAAAFGFKAAGFDVVFCSSPVTGVPGAGGIYPDPVGAPGSLAYTNAFAL
jgi:hypothetical protein